MKKIQARKVFVSVLLMLILSGCASYEQTVVPFKMPTAYPNATQAAGATIAAKAYFDPQEAKEIFGFDIVAAGVLPVQVVFDNQGDHPLEVVAKQTFLIDTRDNLWPILDANLAYDRLEKKTDLGQVAPEAGKGALLAGVAGAVIGAAVGIVTGTNVGAAVGKGAAVGAAAGLTMGGMKGMADPGVQTKIQQDLRSRSLESRPVRPHEIAHGFIFFPGEAKTVKELRLQIREADTNRVHALTLKF